MKILVGKATVEISSEGPDVSLGTELVAYCTHLLHLKPQQRILKRCESVNDEDNIGGDSTLELLRVNHLRYQHCKPPSTFGCDHRFGHSHPLSALTSVF